MFPDVTLLPTTREDVQRMAEWLDDPEVNSFWYGLGEDGTPLHIGYSPHKILQASQSEWDHVFENEDRQIYSLHTANGDHIGEGQLVVEWPLQEAQVFILIGRKELWHQHYGTMSLIHMLDQAFQAHGLHRVWADIPDYNDHALQMFRHLGFVLEGHLRKTHRKDGEWYDSHAIGLLVDEYNRRRSRLMGSATA